MVKGLYIIVSLAIVSGPLEERETEIGIAGLGSLQ